MEEVVALGWGHGVIESADSRPERFHGALRAVSQRGLEPGEVLLKGIKVGRIGRQIQQGGAGGFNRCFHALDLVRGEIVHDDAVARFPEGAEKLPDILEEQGAIDRPVSDHGSNGSLQRERGDEGGGFPVTVRDMGDQPLVCRGAPVASGHVGRCPGFVEKKQPRRIKRFLMLRPGGARFLHVFAPPLAGAYGFF